MKIIANRRTRYIQIGKTYKYRYKIVYMNNGLWLSYGKDGSKAGQFWQEDLDEYIQDEKITYITQREFDLSKTYV